MTDINNTTTKDIASVYSGRPGCCCGCLGNHWYNSAFPTKDYQRTNDAQVKRVLNILKANADRVKDEGEHFFFDTGTR